MRLTIENCPEREQELQAAFAVCVRELGLAGRDHTVVLRVDHDLGEPGARGSTATMTTPRGEIFMRLASKSCDCGGRYCHNSMVSVFCHEMVHVKQMILDGLRTEWDNPMMLYKGVEYDARLQVLADLLGMHDVTPWEKEAYARQGDLLAAVKKENRR